MTETLQPAVISEEDLTTFLDQEDPMAVVVWNDDVNTFDHVIKALMEILLHPRSLAEQLTMRVHTAGKAVVAYRPKDEALAAVQRFHQRTIQATAEP
jgi:ATP-dependent Clp protease adaptor protein ClpS